VSWRLGIGLLRWFQKAFDNKLVVWQHRLRSNRITLEWTYIDHSNNAIQYIKLFCCVWKLVSFNTISWTRTVLQRRTVATWKCPDYIGVPRAKCIHRSQIRWYEIENEVKAKSDKSSQNSQSKYFRIPAAFPREPYSSSSSGSTHPLCSRNKRY
jgi:hypothetical protein